MTSNINNDSIIIEKLNKDLQEKDQLINGLKEKTRNYVAKMKEDHALKLSELENSLILKDKLIENNKSSFEDCQENLKLSKLKVETFQQEIELLQISKKDLNDNIELLKKNNIELIQSNNIIITNLKEQILSITQDSLKLFNSKEFYELEISELKQSSQDLENKLLFANSQYKILEQNNINNNSIDADNIKLLKKNLIEEKDKHSILQAEYNRLVEKNNIQAETIKKMQKNTKNEDQHLKNDSENKLLLDKIDELEKSQDDLRELLNKKDKILEDLEVDYYSISKSLTDSQNSKSELQLLIQNTADTVLNLEIQNTQLKNALNDAESEGNRHIGEGTGELIAIRTELNAKNEMVDILRGEISEIQASLHSCNSTISSMERQRSELLAQKEELHVLIRQGKENSTSQTKLFEEEKKTLRNQLTQIQQSAKQYTTDKIVEIEKLYISIAGKDTELETSKSSIKSLEQTNIKLQRELDCLKNKLSEVTSELSTELFQNKERKEKIRVKFAEITEERKKLEEVAIIKERECREAILCKVLLDEQVVQLEMKMETIKEQSMLTLELKSREKEELVSIHQSILEQKDNEINKLLCLIEKHSQSSVEEIREAQIAIEKSNNELESHKSKRLAARNEMIGMAKTLECTQKDGDELKNILQYSLTPTVFEQISTIEILLMNVEMSCTRLSSKRSMRLHSKANDFLTKRFHKSVDHSDEVIAGNISSPNSRHGLNCVINTLHDGNNGLGHSKGFGASAKNTSNFGKGRQNTILQDSLEKAEYLKSELDRVAAGMALLGQALDRLSEIINVDTRCCGGVWDLIWNTRSGLNYSALEGEHTLDQSPIKSISNNI